MANLLGQNIGTNYKGILNLNTLNGNLTTTLEAITDGDGNASPLQLSTTLARVSSNLTIGGSTTASARLHVRGDGINAVAIFQNSAGTAGIAISSDALTLSVRNYQIGNNSNLIQAFAGAPDPNGSAILYTSIATTAQLYAHNFVSGTRANLTGTSGQLNISGGFAAGAGSGNFRLAGIEYTINNSGAQTGTATGIFLRSTETNLNGMLHNFIDLGTIALGSLFSVANNGAIRVATIADSNAPISSLYFSSTANKLVWKDAGGVVNNLY